MPQVHSWPEGYSIGLMGVINGLFGVDDDYRGAIAYIIETEGGPLLRFMRTPPMKRRDDNTPQDDVEP